jgi:hypothetical protein
MIAAPPGGSGPVKGVLPPMLNLFVIGLPSTKSDEYVTKMASLFSMLKPSNPCYDQVGLYKKKTLDLPEPH